VEGILLVSSIVDFDGAEEGGDVDDDFLGSLAKEREEG